MHSDLQQCYTGQLVLLLSKAAFLDPSLKALLFLSPAEKEELRAAIEVQAAAAPESVEDSQEIQARSPPEKRAKGEHKLLEVLDDTVQPTEDEQLIITYLQKAHAEVTRYFNEPVTTYHE